MSERAHVLEDGVDSTPAPPSSRPSWLVGAVGFALGLGLGVLVVSPGPDTTDDTPVPTTVAAESPVTTIEEPVATPGVAAAVPGFPDAIVAVARTSSTSLDHVLWPLEGEPRIRSMAGGDDVVLDAGSVFIAMSDGVPGIDGYLLSMGRFNSIQPVAAGVVSYAWHDSEGARLAYTQLDGETSRLLTVRADLDPTPVVQLPTASAEVVGWGDWGWAIQQTPDEIVLLTPDGAFKDSEAGVAVATHESGWVFAVEGDEVKLVSAGGGVRRIQAPLDVGTVRGAVFSPDGSKIAVIGSTGVSLLVIETQEVMQLMGFATPSVSWSSDSRFVLAAAPLGLSVIDLAVEGAIVGYSVLDPYSAVAVGVVPLRSS
ncbi:MAG TPA: hypothetical protein VFT85_00040 [Acidimicrobiia bacterium]|nr:hypothetical protein [Acidimicrobiia bacterium]